MARRRAEISRIVERMPGDARSGLLHALTVFTDVGEAHLGGRP